jgi:transcriptional regulator with XRE-family HTH domain
MVSLGERLREERQRLGLNQTDFAAIGCVTKKTQMLYESGERYPGAEYLQALEPIGVDVFYVLMGKRASSPIPTPLARDEVALLENYRASGEDGKKIIRSTADFAAQPAPKAANSGGK